MNIWNCDYPGCKHSCIGICGAVGLAAIGWKFIPGIGFALKGVLQIPRFFCPIHRDEPIDIVEIETRELQNSIKQQLSDWNE